MVEDEVVDVLVEDEVVVVLVEDEVVVVLVDEEVVVVLLDDDVVVVLLDDEVVVVLVDDEVVDDVEVVVFVVVLETVFSSNTPGPFITSTTWLVKRFCDWPNDDNLANDWQNWELNRDGVAVKDCIRLTKEGSVFMMRSEGKTVELLRIRLKIFVSN